MPESPARPVILFDGVCHLCNGFVQFVLARDTAGQFDFAPLQSPFGERALGGRPWDSVVLLDHSGVSVADEAVMRILARLRSPWPAAAAALRLIPGFIRRWGYRMVARNRYRLFGKEDVCMMPRPEWRARFRE